MKTPGTTFIKSIPSRDHTEKLFKYLKLPIKISKNKNFDFISFTGTKNYKAFNYTIPGDISSSSFFIVLTCFAWIESVHAGLNKFTYLDKVDEWVIERKFDSEKNTISCRASIPAQGSWFGARVRMDKNNDIAIIFFIIALH